MKIYSHAKKAIFYYYKILKLRINRKINNISVQLYILYSLLHIKPFRVTNIFKKQSEI